MRQKKRVEKLEKCEGKGLLVVLPTFLDEVGNAIHTVELSEDVEMANFSVDGFEVQRVAGEEPSDFRNRVMGTARDRYHPCILLPHYVANV